MSEERMHRYIIDRYDGLSERSDVREFYNQSEYLNFGYWDENTRNHKQACDNLMEKLLEPIPEKPGKILDVACGKGETTRYLSKYYSPDNVTAINISHKQLDIARNIVPGCNFIKMNATELGFPDNSFDVVICVEAVFHFYLRETFLKEAYRVLKKGGYLVLSDILMTKEGEKRRESRTEENYVASLGEYESIYTRSGFDEVNIIDATET